jgi:hypothetical protein
MAKERLNNEKYGDFDIDFYRRDTPRRTIFAEISQWSDRSDNPQIAKIITKARTKKQAFAEMKEIIDSINISGDDIFLYKRDQADDAAMDRLEDERWEKKNK